MHLTALVESADHVCCRYRLAAFRPLLEGPGHTLALCPLPRGWLARVNCFRRLRGADVVLQRRLLPPWQIAYLRRCVRTLIFDFDDAVFLRDSYSKQGVQDPVRQRRFAATVRACDAVVAGNHFLHARALALTEKPNVRLVPTCIDPTRYKPAEPRESGALELVWVGSSSTLNGLKRTASLLEELGSRIAGLRLRLVCDRTLNLERLPVDFYPWSEANEAGLIAASDIGISWVPDDDWSRGKCGLKVLQYMAAGLPVVANPVGVHREMIRHGETGFLAQSKDEWLAAVTRLMAEPELRSSMGKAGRRVVEQSYSVDRGARLWLGLLDGLDAASVRTA